MKTSYLPFNIMVVLIEIFFVLAAIMPNSFAAHSKITYKNWVVHAREQENQLYCFMISVPQKKHEGLAERKEPYVMVTHINNDRDEVSITSGSPYNNNIPVKVSIDSITHELSLINGDMAWAKNNIEDKRLIKDMKRGKTMTIEAHINNNAKINKVKDVYSLSGFSKAYRRMKYICSHIDLEKAGIAN